MSKKSAFSHPRYHELYFLLSGSPKYFTGNEVASSCGFNDSNHFATVFKSIVGITPKKYPLANKSE